MATNSASDEFVYRQFRRWGADLHHAGLRDRSGADEHDHGWFWEHKGQAPIFRSGGRWFTRAHVRGEFVLGPDYGITFVDLWNGAGNFLPWQQIQLPTNSCIGSSGGGGPICTTPDCGIDPGPMSMTMGGFGEGFEGSSLETESSEFAENENAFFSEWVIGFLAGANPQDEQAEQILQESVDLIVEWCLANLSADEKSALANGLSDPGVIFASSVGQNAAAAVVEANGQ